MKQLYAGIDWASRTHAVGVVDDHGGIRARFEVPNTGKGFGGLIRRLTKLQVAGVAIERPDGPLVEAMLDAGLRVVVITPRQVKALRSRYRATGAKSDTADALLLADVLRTDGHRLQPLIPDSDATIVLRALGRTRKDLQKARVALCNQLTAQLERCFPGAVGLFADLHSATAIVFLRRYPTSQAAATLTQATLTAFLRRIHYSGRTPVAVLLARLKTAPLAAISPDQATGRAVCVQALLDAIQACHSRERELEAEIIERLEVHADQQIFTSLPKAGHGVRAAALLSEIGDVRTRFPTRKPWPPWPASRPSPAPRANSARSASAGRVTKSCATPSSTSPTTPHGRPASTPRPSSAPVDTPRPCASWLAPGSASSGASGKTTPPTTPPSTEGR